jgi:hypothetical protein
MPMKEPYPYIEAVLPQLSDTNSFIHAVASLALSGRMFETLWDITDHVCARHFETSTNATPSIAS